MNFVTKSIFVAITLAFATTAGANELTAPLPKKSQYPGFAQVAGKHSPKAEAAIAKKKARKQKEFNDTCAAIDPEWCAYIKEQQKEAAKPKAKKISTPKAVQQPALQQVQSQHPQVVYVTHNHYHVVQPTQVQAVQGVQPVAAPVTQVVNQPRQVPVYRAPTQPVIVKPQSDTLGLLIKGIQSQRKVINDQANNDVLGAFIKGLKA